MSTSFVRIGATAWLGVSLTTAASAAGPPPRYELKPGQVIAYEEKQDYKGRSGDSEYQWTRRLWVVGQNGDGSWRVVAREGLKSLREQGSQSQQPETVTLARFDVYPDGRIPLPPISARGSTPPISSHASPATRRRRHPAGRSTTTAMMRPSATSRSTSEPRKVQTASISMPTKTTFMERFYEGKDHRTFHFDRSLGPGRPRRDEPGLRLPHAG